ncbi:MAG TPA: polyribonucleotide nucleotidyltransferase [Dehalococcoidia bacterium]|nr:polyribonucleotide nucleotidyltransferase [Dehalococcoidia bacterium]
MVLNSACSVGAAQLVIETGKLAEQANGAVTVRYGDTVVLVTACASQEPREGTDFLALTVDYEERLYAAGKIPGGFIRREGRPTQAATLAARLTDRPLRPLFPKGLSNDIQVVVTVLSADQENSPDILAVIGASAALTISDIPFEGPVAATRIGYIDGQFVVNPTFTQLTHSLLDIVVASTRQAVVMVEGEAREVSEDVALEAIKLGHQENQPIIRLQEELQASCGKPKWSVDSPQPDPELRAQVSAVFDEYLGRGLGWQDKADRRQLLNDIESQLLAKLGESYPASEINSAFEAELKSRVRDSILKQGLRPGGRAFTELRPISCEVGLLPRTHGSGLFSRGQTQVLTITTLGSLAEEQRLDSISPEETKRFMHHYNFPPFSTGEVKRLGSPGRREIGHGALVERALEPVIPDETSFPYTLRLVSEVLSSSGSTSMASTCGASLSLMDAGVPIKSPVAGIAIGLVTGEAGEYAVLTDIEGFEDAYGDMDFKVAGTRQGITAIQMDIKIKGVSFEIIEKAISQAREARLQILDIMQETIAASREELSPYAPRMYRITVDPDKIGNIIGLGGRTIRSITEETKATIDIENDGTVIIGATSEESAQQAIRAIQGLTQEVEVGNVYTGRVSRILSFGAMVEIIPGKEGMVHISELADYRVPRVEDVVKVGDEIMVKVIEIDRLGRINLSRRAVFEDLAQVGGARVRDTHRGGRPSPRREESPRRRPPPGREGGKPRYGRPEDRGRGGFGPRSQFERRR